MRTGFIDDLRNCKRCGSLEHENNLRDDLCPNCYYDVDRFKEEREKAKADNKWLNKWQKLKEFIVEQINFDKEEIEENKEIPNLPNRHYLTIENIILEKMQELEGEDE